MTAETGMPFTPEDAFPLLGLSVADLQGALADGRLTSVELVQLYTARIEFLDREGPQLGHVLELNPDAAGIAADLDRERTDGRLRGPLHGIPILLKDNIASADRMETTAGSEALMGMRPSRDAFIVGRLREAGAVILGKTNLSEWANFRGSPSVSGWSGRGGQTRNPHALDRSPGGSSSGSAVAAAASSCAAAVGTETSGSIIGPASMCGIVGVKPTVGLISRSGIIPIAESQDTAGPMTRTVGDAAIMLSALAATDPADPATAEANARRADYAAGLDADGLRGARIGVLRPLALAVTSRLFDAALGVLRAGGAELVDPIALAAPSPSDQAMLFEYEFKSGIQRYLREWLPDASVRSLEDLIAFNRGAAATELAFFGQERFEQAARRGPLSDEAYLEVQARLRQLTGPDGIDAVMDAHRLDAIVAPSTGPARPIDLVNGDAGAGGSVAGIPAVAGYPHVTVPMGAVAGLPVGLSFFGQAWHEEILLRLAFAFEQAAPHRRLPTFAASAALPWSGLSQ